jgi:hypothetical protein
MARKIVGIIIGYAIFVLSSLALFKLSGQAPHSEATIVFKTFTIIYGFIFSFFGGFVLQIIAKNKDFKLHFILAFVIAGFALFSLIKSDGSHWTQLLAIFIFAPASILGGVLKFKK